MNFAERILIATVRSSRVSLGAINLTHAARPEWRKDAVRTEMGAAGRAILLGALYRFRRSGRSRLVPAAGEFSRRPVPAAVAASMPRSVSSKTKQQDAGATPSLAAASRNASGWGLPFW